MKTNDCPTTPGTPLQGGFYAGRLLIAGVLHALVVAPKSEGETVGAWDPNFDEDADDAKPLEGARSYFDGLANTNAMAEAGIPIANWARGLAIGGFTDWHIPARDQLELLYRHFKPTTRVNYEWRHGDNPSSVPAGYPYTEQAPAQTTVEAFKAGGAEAFADEWHLSSTQYSVAGYAWVQDFDNGTQLDNDKSYERRVRAVRLIQLDA